MWVIFYFGDKAVNKVFKNYDLFGYYFFTFLF